jgi:hypothetical protein
MITLLEQVGRITQPNSLKALINSLPREINDDIEKITRFLLLVAILDQQAESPSARLTAINIYNVFGDELFNKPQNVLLRMDKLVPLKGGYKISPAIGRVLPRFGWMVLRVGAFLIYEMSLNHKRFSANLSQLSSPREAAQLLENNPVLEAVLRDKARRLFISWVGHPALGLDVSQGKWKTSDFEMPVDGHVGKIFSRTGIVSQVIHEAKEGKGTRWNVISASEMRPMIQEVVNNYSNDCIMVDYGAFQIGFNCCPDNLVDISCDSCKKFESCQIASLIGCKEHCILKEFCKRNLTWRAY